MRRTEECDGGRPVALVADALPFRAERQWLVREMLEDDNATGCECAEQVREGNEFASEIPVAFLFRVGWIGEDEIKCGVLH